MSGEVHDVSDAIARIQVSVMTLKAFDPAGEWTEHELVKLWLRDRYALTRGQVRRMIEYLQQQVDIATSLERLKPENKKCQTACL